MPIPYSALRVDLFRPCASGNFFPQGLPDAGAGMCAEMCRLAYCRNASDFALNQTPVEGVLTPLGFSGFQFFNTQGTISGRGAHAFLARHEGLNLAVLAFRGTDEDDPSDLTDDANFRFEAWDKGGKVHAGFAHALGGLRDQIEAARPGIDLKLVVTGHSLGAAMATLLVSAWGPQLKAGWELYTYGSPRVGDAAFVATVDTAKAFRHVDCCDAVTRVPLPQMGYQHVGEPIYIDRNGTVQGAADDAFIKSDRSKARKEYLLKYFARRGTVPVRDLADHAPINYYSGVTGTRV